MSVTRQSVHRTLTGVLSLGLLVGVAIHVGAQTSGGSSTKIDVATLGRQVGQTVPDFSLADQNKKV